MKEMKVFLICIAVFMGIVGLGYITQNFLGWGPPKTQEAVVISVVDGDTIDVLIDDQEYRVRYIGIDAPDMNELEGLNATMAHIHFLQGEPVYQNYKVGQGTTVYLEKDKSETDQYGRLLRYVYKDSPYDEGKIMINELMLYTGNAKVAIYPPDIKYAEKFLEYQQDAFDKAEGIWSK
jgi:micrococcal nuclease